MKMGISTYYLLLSVPPVHYLHINKPGRYIEKCYKPNYWEKKDFSDVGDCWISHAHSKRQATHLSTHPATADFPIYQENPSQFHALSSFSHKHHMLFLISQPGIISLLPGNTRHYFHTATQGQLTHCNVKARLSQPQTPTAPDFRNLVTNFEFLFSDIIKLFSLQSFLFIFKAKISVLPFPLFD